MNRRSLVASLFALALAAPPAFAQTIDGKGAFEKLKGLASTWSGPIGAQNGPKGKVSYEVISGGSVVMEVLFPGEPHEMRSMYHLDKGELTTSSPSKLVFDFDGGTNFDPQKDSYIRDGEVRFLPDGRLEASWNFWANGKLAGANHFLALTKEK